jgi:hypothetical protein
MAGSSVDEQPLGAQAVDLSSAFGFNSLRYRSASRADHAQLLAGRDTAFFARDEVTLR